ncbi:caffeoylshikimate esterase-like [Bidens hawaiensis]|uniref:caffeoylshikimate esterase-like n=1 Tax=Bidens hawaiensis TaxID=980011 RepID=UPI00404923DC
MATEASKFIYEEEFIVNSKGLQLFTCRWLPVDTEPRALIFLNHGYGMECSVSMKGAALRLVKAGFAVYGIDNQGHGKSSGMQAYIPSFDDLVTDCSDFFTSICEKKENKRKMRILLGESMGGAIVLLVHLKKPEYWDGAVLVAPFCKIADDIKPPQLVISMLTKLTKIIPTWKIIPGKNFVNIVFRDAKIRDEVR